MRPPSPQVVPPVVEEEDEVEEIELRNHDLKPFRSSASGGMK